MTDEVVNGEAVDGGQTPRKAPKKMGRPSSYTPEQAEAICALIAQGNSLRPICQRADMPSKSMAMRWLAEHEEFRDQYARAHEEQADRLFEECLAIADNDTGDIVVSKPLTHKAGLWIRCGVGIPRQAHDVRFRGVKRTSEAAHWR